MAKEKKEKNIFISNAVAKRIKERINPDGHKPKPKPKPSSGPVPVTNPVDLTKALKGLLERARSCSNVVVMNEVRTDWVEWSKLHNETRVHNDEWKKHQQLLDEIKSYIK